MERKQREDLDHMAKKSKKQSAPKTDTFDVLTEKIASSLDADILFYNAPIERHYDQRVIELCNSRRRRPNVALFLVTSGGDADAAYRIAACLQNKYKHFTLCVPGFCKSAGTLIALGAHRIAMSDQGENGPLDVQMRGKDELIASESGLTSTTTLATLNEQVYSAFEYFLLKITKGAGPSIGTKTIADIAVKLTCGTFSHIYQQVDPKNVAEAERALQIAKSYGLRLASVGKNLARNPLDSLEHLISHYPSHGFIIDFAEAKSIFKDVREFSADENSLVKLLGPLGRWPIDRDQEKDYLITFISNEIPLAAAITRQGGQKNGQRKKPGSKNKRTTRTANTEAAPGTGAPNIAQLPTIHGSLKRPA
jgi:hypothetical protein